MSFPRISLPAHCPVLGLIFCLLAGPAPAKDCAKLASLRLEHATITAAETMPLGSTINDPVTGMVPAAKAEYCRVQIVAKPSADSDIHIELWIPAAAVWNGKFEQVGNGGFAGIVPYGHMAEVMSEGYAVAGTDDGHQSQSVIDASWALRHPEKIKDYGWRAILETASLSKHILRSFRGKAPSKSYFVGCSDGGREGLMMAERFPTEFDGIVAGAPAYAMTRLLTGGALRGLQLSEGVAHVTSDQLALLQRTALETCAAGAPFLNDPRQCHVDLSKLACAAAMSKNCLSLQQITAVHDLYADLKDPAGRGPLYGVLPGAEAAKGGWETWLIGSDGHPGAGLGFTWNYLAFMVMNDPKLDLAKVTPSDILRGERQIGPEMDAESAYLAAFRKHGGKLIQYHGWNDPGIAPGYSLEYRERLLARMGPAEDFYRLYMIPGMLHCGGGDAPSNVNWQAALESWVERNEAPGVLIATGPKGATQALPPFK